MSVASALRRISPGTLPSVAYRGLQANGVIRSDAHQGSVLPLLDALHSQVSAAARSRGSAAPANAPSSGGLWGSVFGAAAALPRALPQGQRAPPAGLYLWGGTGSGKTMLMDVFLACAPSAARARRVHFHEFMQGVNARLHAVRSSGVRGDPLSVVARDLTNEHWMLCFDEVQVTDVGDAMVLRRLFEGLYENGLVMLATSNRAPSELYAGGLQRELFMPFVSLLNARCGVHHLASPNDHRLRVLSGGRGAGSASSSPWLCPAPSLDPREHAAGLASVSRAFESAWEAAAAAHGEAECPQALPVEGQGRDFLVPRALPKARAARFTFSELCGAPLYAGDYAALTRHFGHLFLEGIPVLGMGERNELRRLVTLVDILYDSKVRLTASAAADPTETFRVDEEEHQGSEGQARARRQQLPSSGVERISIAPSHHKAKYDEVFAWDRAVSRLIEMGSSEYAA